MKKIFIVFVIIFFHQLIMNQLLLGQGRVYEGPDDPAGDIAAIREGYMTGNRVFLYFKNTTELSDWPKVNVSKWPNNDKGVKMTDGIGLLIGARVYIENDSIPVTDPVQIASRTDLDTLYFLQTSYREEMDKDPTGNLDWGLYPVFGYFNENSEYPAMSNDSTTWPVAGWPAQGTTLKWPGEWDGRFGRGVIYADLETYFVANDAQDQEYLGPEDRVKYYPRPGVHIGDLRPSVTIQRGLPWGGIGIRVQQRGFQWNNPQARDAIFWEYNIANISDYDLPEVAFGYWVDNAIGQDSDDELGYFDRKIDMAYSWDIDGVGRGGIPTGTMGFAYLESPGLAYDNIDNDEDGLLDEKRDNTVAAGEAKIGPTDGIINLTNFLEFYRLSLEDLHDHYAADEDQDWEDGEDINGDGIYQFNEYAGDDVGLDGVGPTELNYNGPDEGECNHKPDFVEGLGCEPNFAFTDVSESDMVGLTSFMLFPIQPHRPPYEKWFRNDKSMWEVIGSDTLVEYLGNISNLVETFASGPFPLYKGRTERISMSELHSYDPLEGLNSEEHSAPALFEQKRIVQIIYEKDYRFAQPPKMPTLYATPGDGMVILTWDNIADTKTRDPFVGNINDFEGYKLFRATDKKMSDAEVITDGFGTPMFKKPIFQCDLKDGIRGFTDFGLVNGMGYNLGYDSGITHYFIDNNVQNGRTYYYALVAYDFGAPDIGPGISPSENSIIIDLDEAEEVRGTSKNVQIVIPYQKAAGYIPPKINEIESNNVLGTGTVSPEILAERSIKNGHKYLVKFLIDTIKSVSDYDHGIVYSNSGIQVYDITGGEVLVYEENPQRFAYNNISYKDTVEYIDWDNYWYFKTYEEIQTDIFDGLRLRIKLPFETAYYDFINSGWKVGNAPIRIVPTEKESILFPWDYEIVFTDDDSAYVGRVTTKNMRDENGMRINRAFLMTKQNFNFYVINKSFTDSSGNYELMDLVVHDQNQNAQFDILEDRILVGPVNNKGLWAGTVFIFDFNGAKDSTELPQPNDVYHVTFQRPFWITDSLTFTIEVQTQLDVADLKNTMEKIKVVPNPYIATNAMEPWVSNWYLNQRRRIMFTNIPASCTIKIFTVSGVLVDEIDVENPNEQGIAYWDLLTKEGLEVAAGMYIYHIKAKKTGDEKIGKFALIK